MKTLASGLDAFNARGLANQRDGDDDVSHRRRPEPQRDERPAHHLGQRRRVPPRPVSTSDPGKVVNNQLHNTLITAAIRDKSTMTVNFGKGTTTGMIPGLLAG